MVIRYALLVALVAASVWAVFDVSTAQAPMFLVDAGQTGAVPTGVPYDIAFWLLAGIATLTTFSLCRFVIFGLPSMIGEWYQGNKSWLYMLIIGGMMWGAFYWM